MTMTGSMYAAISGLNVHSQGISVISNNLANTSTIGYKTATAQFEDIFYSAVNTASGIDQVGHGAKVSTIYNSFAQGAYEASTEVTDVAIDGDGFFLVTDPTTGETFYTRAGNFRFDKNGYLVDSHGYRVQGWYVDPESDAVSTIGSIGDLQVDMSQSPPKATTALSIEANLDRTADDGSVDSANPFFAMFNQWDGTEDTPLGDSRYAYQDTIVVYDEAGSSHELTVYFDPVNDSAVASDASGNTVWEYVVTCDPSEDGRIIDGQNLDETSAAGVLMTGTLTFNSAGEMIGMTAFTLDDTAAGDLKDLNNWTPAEFDEDGYPVFTANFTGSSDASATTQTSAMNISLDLGMNAHDLTGSGWDGAVSNAAALGNSYSNLFTYADAQISASATTSYEQSSTTLDHSQDGYAPGFLNGVDVDTDGVVSGTYSNGQIIELFALGLANFANPQGLSQVGGNLFSETLTSGEATTGLAGTGNLGDISPSTLEQSNVDMATEMVRLITMQRGYQANSKVITTTDTLLQEAINLKR